MTSTKFSSSFILAVVTEFVRSPFLWVSFWVSHRPTDRIAIGFQSVSPRQQKCSRLGKEDAGNQLSDAFPLSGELGVED